MRLKCTLFFASVNIILLWGLANLSVYNISSLINQCHVIPDSCQVGVWATSISVLHYAENLWGCHYVNFSSVKVTVFQTTVTLLCRLFLPQSELCQYFEYFPHCSARQSSHGCLSNTRSLGKSWAPSWDTLSKGTKASDLTELQTRTVSTAFRYEQGNETLLPRPFFFPVTGEHCAQSWDT